MALLIIGGWLVIERQLTLGQLVASELVLAVIGAGFAKLGKQMEKVYDATASIHKIGQIVNLAQERMGGVPIMSTRPAAVALTEVEDPRIVQPIDVDIRAGETLAVTGQAATGKSTLLNLMRGRLVPERGVVRADGVDLDRADLKQFRTGVCFIDDTGRLPDMTIAELLRLQAPAASTSALREVIDTVGLTAAIQRLPNELDETLLPDGAPLSRQQVLRLNAARLLLHQPRLALIDGALDALADDPPLLDAVLGGPWTTVVVTGSEAVMSRAARTLYLKAQP